VTEPGSTGNKNLQDNSTAVPPAGSGPRAAEMLLAEVLLSEDLGGQSVLSIGSGSGFIPLKALRNGAIRVAVVDANRHTIGAARAAAQTAGFSPEFIDGKWDDVCAGIGEFDTIVCSLRPPAIRDPFAAIGHMMTRTRKRLIIEFDCPRRSDGVAYALALLAGNQPLVWLPKPAKPGRVLHRPFLFTAAAVRHLFAYHSTLFEPIRILWPNSAGRFVIEARRRRVRNLLVVAGPTSSGKSTFASRLAADSRLRDDFGLSGDWTHIRGRDVAHLPTGDIENLIVELDLMAVERGDIASFDDIPQFQILRAAENLQVLTMIPVHPPGNIRMSGKEIGRLNQKCGALGEALVGFYRRQGDGRRVRQLYAAWFDWARQRGAHEMRLIVNDFTDFVPLPVSEFDRAFDRALTRS
jgi:hypothetical protein